MNLKENLLINPKAKNPLFGANSWMVHLKLFMGIHPPFPHWTSIFVLNGGQKTAGKLLPSIPLGPLLYHFSLRYFKSFPRLWMEVL